MNRDSHYGLQEHKEAIHAQALLASFAWSYGLACYQGKRRYAKIKFIYFKCVDLYLILKVYSKI